MLQTFVKQIPLEFAEAKPGHYSACHHIDRVGGEDKESIMKKDGSLL
ncbi:MAG: hypothetical protein ACLR23_18010 [Clostridia bacterium]